MECVAVCCSVVQCVAVWCSVLQCVAISCTLVSGHSNDVQECMLQSFVVCCSVVECPHTSVQDIATYCDTLQHTTIHCNTLIMFVVLCTAQDASWEQVFDLIYTLLFDLYHELRSEALSDFHPFE